MNAAACLVPEVDVLPLNPPAAGEAEKSDADAPPSLPKGSLKVPSCRDMEIYEDVVFAGKSQRDVAKEFGVSQPRVNQILQEIAAWMADNTPNFCSGLTPEQKLRLVHYNVVQQLEHQRCVLMAAWEESRTGTETISRTAIVDNVRRTIAYNRPRSGKVNFLNAAARVSLAIAKLAGWTPGTVVPDAPQDSPWWQMGEEEEVGRGQRKEVRPEVSSVSCSPSPVSSSSEGGLSPWEERAKDPNLTRGEMDALTAEQEAVCATLQAKVADLESKIRRSEIPLSPGTGPLLPEGGNGSKQSRKEDNKRVQRREFLREEATITNIRDAFGRKTPLSG